MDEHGQYFFGLRINSMVIFHGYVSHNQMVTSPASMGLTVFPIA